jgi:hypothetical protein
MLKPFQSRNVQRKAAKEYFLFFGAPFVNQFFIPLPLVPFFLLRGSPATEDGHQERGKGERNVKLSHSPGGRGWGKRNRRKRLILLRRSRRRPGARAGGTIFFIEKDFFFDILAKFFASWLSFQPFFFPLGIGKGIWHSRLGGRR